MTTEPRCRYNLDARCPTQDLRAQLLAAEDRADRLADQIDRLRQDAEDDRDEARR